MLKPVADSSSDGLPIEVVFVFHFVSYGGSPTASWEVSQSQSQTPTATTSSSAPKLSGNLDASDADTLELSPPKKNWIRQRADRTKPSGTITEMVCQ